MLTKDRYKRGDQTAVLNENSGLWQVHKKAHISTINKGDTVVIDGIEKTIGKNDIKKCPLMGHSLFGDSSKRMISIVLFPSYKDGVFHQYVRQR